VGSDSSFSLLKKLFIDNGYDILQINYEGTLGYGKDSSIRLAGNIGVLDVDKS